MPLPKVTPAAVKKARQKMLGSGLQESVQLAANAGLERTNENPELFASLHYVFLGGDDLPHLLGPLYQEYKIAQASLILSLYEILAQSAEEAGTKLPSVKTEDVSAGTRCAYRVDAELAYLAFKDPEYVHFLKNAYDGQKLRLGDLSDASLQIGLTLYKSLELATERK